MEIIYKPRQSGKTTELINISDKTGYYIVCADVDRCNYVRDLAIRLGKKIPYPVTFTEFLQRSYSTNIRGLLIDDAEDLLQRIAIVPVKVATLSALSEEEYLRNGIENWMH